MRLLLGAAAAIFVALAVAWLIMTLLFTRHIERRVADELTRSGIQLVAALALAPDGTLILEDEPSDDRFEEPASGLYWQLSAGAQVLHSASLWDDSLPVPAVANSTEWVHRYAQGPFRQALFLLERSIRLEPSGTEVLVQLGLDTGELDGARTEFSQDLGWFLSLLWAVLLLAAWLQVHLGLYPLARIGEQVGRLRRNPAARLDGSHPREITPLIQAINGLAEAREKDLLRARRRAADLAHSLKTPIAALRAQSRRARAAGADDAADGLTRAIDTMAAAVEAELARARAASIRERDAGRESSPLIVAERVIGVLERTEIGARIIFEVEIPAPLRIGIEDVDLAELLGALLENAARFARRRVRIRAATEPDGGVHMNIEDDGRGLDISAEAALLRGGRLDEAGAHQGIGLSLAHDLVEATRGHLSLHHSELGGLNVAILWPAPDG